MSITMYLNSLSNLSQPHGIPYILVFAAEIYIYRLSTSVLLITLTHTPGAKGKVRSTAGGGTIGYRRSRLGIATSEVRFRRE